jgi:hypothetical protein
LDQAYTWEFPVSIYAIRNTILILLGLLADPTLKMIPWANLGIFRTRKQSNLAIDYHNLGVWTDPATAKHPIWIRAV